ALYRAIRRSHHGVGWRAWPEEDRDRRDSAIERARSDSASLLETAYVQWTLSEQWEAAHQEMRELGVELMGDVPFVVCAESADAWARASQFQLALSLGAPPDDFSADGQDWGLPAYDWLAMEGDDLAWIRERTRRAASLYDRFRLDHVVGYFRQWVRRRGAAGRGWFDPEGPDAQRARGRRVLGAIASEVSGVSEGVAAPRIVGEDLGVIPPFVREALGEIGMPGYRVLPWEKEGGRLRDPRSFPRSSVVSWSTHDTAPIDAWWDDLAEHDQAQISERAGGGVDLRASDEGARSLALLRDLYSASSDLALVLAQEVIGVRDRINTPATVTGQNWTWRLPLPIEDMESDPELSARLSAIGALVRGAGR
ncbi:MAG: 4-alpha-glucanotransferase, partial [Polyangiaceae bacterium]